MGYVTYDSLFQLGIFLIALLSFFINLVGRK